MVAKPRNWGNEIIKMILIVSNHDLKKNLKLLACICKTLSKTLHITKKHCYTKQKWKNTYANQVHSKTI